MSYLVRNKAGPVSRADWPLFVKATGTKIPKLALPVRPSTSPAPILQDHHVALQHKPETLKMQNSYAKKLSNQENRPHEDEMKR
jgi:hypothetical protein